MNWGNIQNWGQAQPSLGQYQVSAPMASPAAASSGWMDRLGGLSGIASVGGAAAQIYSAIQSAEANRKLIKEQKKMNDAYMAEAAYNRSQRQKMQNNINSVYGV